MGSNHPPGFYDDDDMIALTQAFREIWKTVTMSDPFRDFASDERLRQNIVQTMMDLSAENVLSVDELRDRTLAKLGMLHKSAKSPATRQRRRRQAA